jgi:hypothetical protein
LFFHQAPKNLRAETENTHTNYVCTVGQKDFLFNWLVRIDETGKFKVIRDDKKTRDKSYARIINVYKAGKINHKEYMRRIVKLRRMHDLPKQRAVLFRALEKSDSESD